MRTKNKFYLLLIGISLLATACNDNTSELINNEKKFTAKSNIPQAVNNNIKSTKTTSSSTSTFTFKNFENQTSILNLKNDHYNFANIEQPIVMVNLSATWCPPCRGEVPHLNNLQKKFKKDFFILTALVHDNIKENELKKLIISEKVYSFVSTNQEENLKFEKMIRRKLGISENFKLPLMILFSNGKYFTHYEGSMPEEMIESDIKQLLEKIKKREK